MTQKYYSIKRHVLFISLSLLGILSAYPQKYDLAAIYRQIDAEIAKSGQYVEEKEKQLVLLRNEYHSAKDDAQRLSAANSLFNQYRSYRNDSTIFYIERCIELSTAQGNKAKAAGYTAQLAYQWSMVGYNTEALDILNAIDTLSLDRDGWVEYYKAMHHVYNDLGYYTATDKMRNKYYAIAGYYSEKIKAIIDHNSDDYLQIMEMEAFNAHNKQEALRLNDIRMKQITPDKREYSIVAFYRNLDYAIENDSVQVRYWLAQAVMGDVQHAVMDQGALWELAHLLETDGDTERSNKYINFAWKCAEQYGTRLRGMQILPVLSSVNSVYQSYLTRSNSNMRLAIIAITLLALALVALLFYVIRNRNRLALAKQQLSVTNEQLKQMNTEQQQLNKRLSELNQEMEAANLSLRESNKLKEEYIGKYMHVCTAYIDKMDEWRKQLHKLIKNREYEEAYMRTRSSEFKTQELEEFYVHFDEGFLSLFPQFVEEFNNLLVEEERINLAAPKRLNTTLRIFALVRLGFDDSKEIADLLHCSMSTIYNYRTKARNSYVGNRNEFELRVKEIGSTL